MSYNGWDKINITHSSHTSFDGVMGVHGGDINFANATNDVNFKIADYTNQFNSDIDGTGVDMVIMDSNVDPLHSELMDKDGNPRFQFVDWEYLLNNKDCTWEEWRAQDITLQELDAFTKTICDRAVEVYAATYGSDTIWNTYPTPVTKFNHVKEFNWWMLQAIILKSNNNYTIHNVSDPTTWTLWKVGQNRTNSLLALTRLYGNGKLPYYIHYTFPQASEPYDASQVLIHDESGVEETIFNNNINSEGDMRISNTLGDQIKITVTKSVIDNSEPPISMSVTFIVNDDYQPTLTYRSRHPYNPNKNADKFDINWEYGTPAQGANGMYVTENTKELNSVQTGFQTVKYAGDDASSTTVLPPIYTTSEGMEHDIVLPVSSSTKIGALLNNSWHVQLTPATQEIFKKMGIMGTDAAGENAFRVPVNCVDGAKLEPSPELNELTGFIYYNAQAASADYAIATEFSSSFSLNQDGVYGITVETGSSGTASPATTLSSKTIITTPVPGVADRFSLLPGATRYIQYMSIMTELSDHGDGVSAMGAGLHSGYAKNASVFFIQGLHMTPFISSSGERINLDGDNTEGTDKASWWVTRMHKLKKQAGITRPTIVNSSIGGAKAGTPFGARINRVPRHLTAWGNSTGSVGLQGIFGNSALIMDQDTSFYLGQVSRSTYGSYVDPGTGNTRLECDPWTTYFGDINDKLAVREHNYSIQRVINRYGVTGDLNQYALYGVPIRERRKQENPSTYTHALKTWWGKMASDRNLNNKYAVPTEQELELLNSTGSMNPNVNPTYAKYQPLFALWDIHPDDEFFTTDPYVITQYANTGSDGYIKAGQSSNTNTLVGFDKMTDEGVIFTHSAGNNRYGVLDDTVHDLIKDAGPWPKPKIEYYPNGDGLHGNNATWVYNTGPFTLSPTITCKIFSPIILHPNQVTNPGIKISNPDLSTAEFKTGTVYQVAFHDPSIDIIKKLPSNVTGSIISASFSSNNAHTQLLSGSTFDLQATYPDTYKQVDDSDLMIMPVFLTSLAKSHWDAVTDRELDPTRQVNKLPSHAANTYWDDVNTHTSGTVPVDPRGGSGGDGYDNPYKYINELLVSRAVNNAPQALNLLPHSHDLSGGHTSNRFFNAQESVPYIRKSFIDKINYQLKGAVTHSTDIVEFIQHNLYTASIAACKPTWRSLDGIHSTANGNTETPAFTKRLGPKYPTHFPSGELAEYTGSELQGLYNYFDYNNENQPELVALCDPRLPENFISDVRGLVSSGSNLIMQADGWIPYTNLKQYTSEWNAIFRILEVGRSWSSPSMQNAVPLYPQEQASALDRYTHSRVIDHDHYYLYSQYEFLDYFNFPSALLAPSFSYHNIDWFDGGMKNGREVSTFPSVLSTEAESNGFTNPATYGPFADQQALNSEATYSGMTLSQSIYQFEETINGDVTSSARGVRGLFGVLPWYSASQDKIPYTLIEPLSTNSTELHTVSSSGETHISSSFEYISKDSSFSYYNTHNTTYDEKWHRRVYFEQTTSYWLSEVLSQPNIYYDATGSDKYHDIPVNYNTLALTRSSLYPFVQGYYYATDFPTVKMYIQDSAESVDEQDNAQFIGRELNPDTGFYLPASVASNRAYYSLHQKDVTTITVEGVADVQTLDFNEFTNLNSVELSLTNVHSIDPHVSKFVGQQYTGTGRVEDNITDIANFYNNAAVNNLPNQGIDNYLYGTHSLSYRYSPGDVGIEEHYLSKNLKMWHAEHATYVRGYYISQSGTTSPDIELRSGSLDVGESQVATLGNIISSSINMVDGGDTLVSSSNYLPSVQLLPVNNYQVYVLETSSIDTTNFLFSNQLTQGLSAENTTDWVTLTEMELYNKGIIGSSDNMLLVVSGAVENTTPSWYTGLLPFLGRTGATWNTSNRKSIVVGACDDGYHDNSSVAVQPTDTFWVEGGYSGSVNSTHLKITANKLRVSHSISEYYTYKANDVSSHYGYGSVRDHTSFYNSNKSWDPALNATQSNNVYSGSFAGIKPGMFGFHNEFTHGKWVDAYAPQRMTVGGTTPLHKSQFWYYLFTEKRDHLRKWWGLSNYVDQLPIVSTNISEQATRFSAGQTAIANNTSNKRSILAKYRDFNVYNSTSETTFPQQGTGAHTRVRRKSMVNEPATAGGFDYYKRFSGTSAANPSISGMVAALLQLYPTATSFEILEILNSFSYKNAFVTPSQIGLNASSSYQRSFTVNNFNDWFHGMIRDPHMKTSIVNTSELDAFNSPTTNRNSMIKPGFNYEYGNMSMWFPENRTDILDNYDTVQVDTSNIMAGITTFTNKIIKNYYQYTGEQLMEIIVPEMHGTYGYTWDYVKSNNGVVPFSSNPLLKSGLGDVYMYNMFDGEGGGRNSNDGDGYTFDFYAAFNNTKNTPASKTLTDVYSVVLAKHGISVVNNTTLFNVSLGSGKSEPLCNPDYVTDDYQPRHRHANPFNASLTRYRWLVPLYNASTSSYGRSDEDEYPNLIEPDTYAWGPHWMIEKLRRQYLGTWNNYAWGNNITRVNTISNVAHWPFKNTNASEVGLFQNIDGKLGSNLEIAGPITFNIFKVTASTDTAEPAARDLQTTTSETTTFLLNDQYTDGTEFTTLDIYPYTGFYHIHPSHGAMVGARHSDIDHEILTPVSTEVSNSLVQKMATLTRTSAVSSYSNVIDTSVASTTTTVITTGTSTDYQPPADSDDSSDSNPYGY